MGIFVPVPFRAFEARHTCSPLLIGAYEFSKFINSHSQRYPARSIQEHPLQNLLTRVCKSPGASHTKMTIIRSSCVKLQNFEIVTHLSIHILWEFN